MVSDVLERIEEDSRIVAWLSPAAYPVNTRIDNILLADRGPRP